jgi:LuxR family transcriptional regulator, maltose regulon positive regulatory protein
LEFGGRYGFQRVFINAGAAIAGLLQRMPPAPFRDRLLQAMAASTERKPAGSTAGGALSAGDAGQAFSERELSILRRMAAGRSNAEIAAEMYLSVNTVRWYAAQIYTKLGVGGRGEAAAKARELGII